MLNTNVQSTLHHTILFCSNIASEAMKQDPSMLSLIICCRSLIFILIRIIKISEKLLLVGFFLRGRNGIKEDPRQNPRKDPRVVFSFPLIRFLI